MRCHYSILMLVNQDLSVLSIICPRFQFNLKYSIPASSGWAGNVGVKTILWAASNHPMASIVLTVDTVDDWNSAPRGIWTPSKSWDVYNVQVFLKLIDHLFFICFSGFVILNRNLISGTFKGNSPRRNHSSSWSAEIDPWGLLLRDWDILTNPTYGLVRIDELIYTKKDTVIELLTTSNYKSLTFSINSRD